MTPEPYDFRKPAPLPATTRALLSAWLPRVCQAARKQLTGQVPFSLDLEPADLEVQPAGRFLEALPESALRFRAGLADSGDVSLLVLPRPAVLALLGALLGEPAEADMPDRDLTPIEEEVSEFVAREFFLEPLSRSWTLTPKLVLEPLPATARSLPSFPPASLLVVASFHLRGPFGQLQWWWALPRTGWLDTVGGTATGSVAVPSREEREALVCEWPLQLTVHLGSTTLSLVHLAELQEGDVLLLEQRVDQPLSATLGGQVKYFVWPGAVGTRQAVAIHSLVELEP